MSYRLKLTVSISILIAIAFGIGGTLIITTSFSSNLEQETETALNSFESIQNTLYLLNALGAQTDFVSLTEALRQMETQDLNRWQSLLLKVDDKLLFQSGKSPSLNYDLPVPDENRCTSLSVSDSYGQGLILKSTMAAGSSALELTARFDLTSVYEMRQAQQQQYLITYITVLLFGMIGSVILSFALTGHLRRLTATVRRISGGDLSKRSKITSADEIGQLSRDFDAMADKLQETISKMEEDMQRQEQFLGAFAHELKTPMTSIIGFADLLRQDNMDENTRIMAADYIYSEGRRLERLSFKLLELLLLKKDEIIMKRVWLSTYLSEIERALAPNMKSKGIRLVCKAEPARVCFEADLVKSLLYNLIDNASKATDDGGIIAVRATAINGGCQFQVADNGRGMEPEELQRITEAFYRVDKARSRSQGGAGLGLALCKQIVELHHGYIQFSSVPGKGTRVTVTLYEKDGSET